MRIITSLNEPECFAGNYTDIPGFSGWDFMACPALLR